MYVLYKKVVREQTSLPHKHISANIPYPPIAKERWATAYTRLNAGGELVPWSASSQKTSTERLLELLVIV